MTKQYCCSCMEPLETEELCSFCGFRQSDYHAEAHQLSPGAILRDRYAIGRVLGEGGFGITYVGKDIVLERKVAVKEFYMSGYVNRNCTVSSEVMASVGTQGDTFEKNKEKFLTEARVLAKFDDEGIVNIRDFFQENNTAYIVMDFLSGETLRDYVKRVGKLTAEEIISILEPVFQALSNVHAHDLIHRDISPDNIMLTDDGKVKLLDFGAAREVSKADVKSLSIILKPGYAPEEQYRSKGRQGPWTDIYALCATMYRCITGIVPEDAMDRIFGDSVVPPAQLDCACSPAMSHVIMKGLSVRGADRYQTISELWDAICMAEEHPEYVPHLRQDPDDERTVYSAPASAGRAEEDDATVYAGASYAVPVEDPDATVYSGHSPLQEQPTRKTSSAPKTTGTAVRSERFQRSTGSTMQRPVASAQARPAAQPAKQSASVAEEQPAKKKKSKLPLILSVVALVLVAAGLGFFFAKKGGNKTTSPDSQQAVTLPAMDQGEISDLMGGDISVSTKEATLTVPLETRNMIERGFKLEPAGKDPLPAQLDAGATCEVVMVTPQGVRGQTVYTLQNFLNVPAPVEESVIVAVAIDDIAQQESLAVSCKSGGGELKVTPDSDLETLEQEAEALHLSLQKDPDEDCWRVYLDPDGSGAYLEFRLGEDGETLDVYISTGHVVEEYYEAHPPVQTPAVPPHAGGTMVTGMSYDREELLEQMGGDMEIYWNGKTMRLPASVLELKEQGFPLDHWAGSEVITTVPANVQKTAMIDNDASDSGYMYIGVHNYTATEQLVDGCWIADVEVFGVQHYRDFQLSWWTPGGQFFLHGGMTAEEVRQEAANNSVCILPEDAVHSDAAEDMMLSVAEDGSLIQLVLFFDEDGSLMDLTVLMGHVYERYFELHPEEATPVTESTEGISYERDLLVEYIGGDVRLTWDNGACALPMSYGEFLHQGYPISEWAGFSGGGPASLTPDSMATACIWRDNNAFGSGNGNVDIGVKNYADVDLEPEFCMISDLSIWDVHTYENVCLTWNAPNGEFQITNEMTEADIVDQANRLGLNVISDPVQSSEHITKKFTADTGNKIEIITFFEPDGKFHGIHIFADNGQKQYFEQYPMQALPMGNGPDYNVEQVRAAMGFEMNVSWGEYSVTLPMPTEQYLAQGYQMQTMQFDDMMDPFEGYNAAFYHAAGGTSSVNYFIMNYTGAQLRQAHSLIVELQSMVEYSTRDMTVTVTFPEGTMTVSAGMTQAEVEVELARFGLAFSAPEPNISTRKVELMDQEGQAFIDVDFNEEGIVKYLRAWVDGFCAKYYGMNPTP